jgi:NTE family protein
MFSLRKMRIKVVSLALQGGGSHGAFTWGVLDRLLEEERIDIEAISGASAGAMNAVVLAYGLTIGGREGARQALTDFWATVSSKVPFHFMPEDAAFNTALTLARYFSPYQLNPFNVNALRSILASQLDFERLRADCKINLFIATTQISTGTLRLFSNKQVSLDVLLASACLPGLNHAVQIDGEAYWDGGLTANPPMFPLLYHSAANDVIMILLHPRRRTETPTSADDISHRVAEIGFSSTFFSELQGLALAKREAERSPFAVGRMKRQLRRLNLHLIDAQELMSRLSALSKLNTRASFINALRDEGRSHAEVWLAENIQSIGVRSSFSPAELLLG